MYTHTHIHTYRNGDTALHLAVVRNSAECVQALLDPESKARAAPTHAHTNTHTHTHARTHTQTHTHCSSHGCNRRSATRAQPRTHAHTVARTQTQWPARTLDHARTRATPMLLRMRERNSVSSPMKPTSQPLGARVAFSEHLGAVGSFSGLDKPTSRRPERAARTRTPKNRRDPCLHADASSAHAHASTRLHSVARARARTHTKHTQSISTIEVHKVSQQNTHTKYRTHTKSISAMVRT
jgi:hypothetical protein